MSPTDAGEASTNDWRLKVTCPERAPRRQKPSPADGCPDTRASRGRRREANAALRPQSHGRTGALPALTPRGLPLCATIDPGPGGHPRRRGAGVSSLLIPGSQ